MTLLKCVNIYDGTAHLYRASNNYGASVVCHSFSYGGKQGLYELAVVYFADESDNFEIVYNTPITDDVIGNLTDEQVMDYLSQIEAL